MSTPDPKTVREIAEDAIREGARTASIEDVLTGHPVVDHDDPESDYDAWFDAIAAQVHKPTVIVEWPDEQQPDDVVTAEQQQDGAVGRVEAFLTAWRYYGNDGLVSSECQPGETRKYAELTEADLRAVLAERTALAARVAESRDALTVAAELLDRFASETPCTVGGDICREHGYTRKPCPHPLARLLVDAWRAVQAEDAALAAAETEES